jgi:hypothetical protein
MRLMFFARERIGRIEGLIGRIEGLIGRIEGLIAHPCALETGIPAFCSPTENVVRGSARAERGSMSAERATDSHPREEAPR